MLFPGYLFSALCNNHTHTHLHGAHFGISTLSLHIPPKKNMLYVLLSDPPFHLGIHPPGGLRPLATANWPPGGGRHHRPRGGSHSPRSQGALGSNLGSNTGFPKIVGFPPKSSILIRFSIINHPFWGTPIFGNIHMEQPYWKLTYPYIFHISLSLGKGTSFVKVPW